MKKNIYYSAFILLGILVGFLVHAFVDMGVIALLVADIDKWGLGFSWDAWFTIHTLWTVVTVVLGAFVGFRYAKHYWVVFYK